MSRRHHGRPHHARHRPDAPRPELAARQTPPTSIDASAAEQPVVEAAPPLVLQSTMDGTVETASNALQPATITTTAAAVDATPLPVPSTGNGHAHLPDRAQTSSNGAAFNGGSSNGAPINGAPINGRDERPNGCTAPQLRRFIKSRPYVPMHELRRRFAIDGGEDDVTQVRLDEGHVYVGLPAREGSLLGELLRGGEIGYELSFDPRAPIVVGVYPMRPVPRT
jgi:hypothetical protein